MHAALTSISVKPGAVTQVNLGGSGVTVVGKVRLVDSAARINWEHSQGHLHTPFPEAFYQKTPQEQEAWFASPEGRKVASTMKSYPVAMAPDGSFQAEEVPPGKYDLNVYVNASGAPTSMPAVIGRFHHLVTVPNPHTKDDDAPIDVGTIGAQLESMPEQTSAPVK